MSELPVFLLLFAYVALIVLNHLVATAKGQDKKTLTNCFWLSIIGLGVFVYLYLLAVPTTTDD